MKLTKFHILVGKCVLALALLLSFGQARAADHYFATAGDDSTGDGSISSPWKTITKANDQCSEDNCYFNRGDTFAGKLTFSPGTTYGAYGTGAKPIIQGSGADFAGYCNSCNTITVQDIEFKNEDFTTVQIRSAYAALTGITFQRNKFNVTGTVTYASDVRGIHVDTNGYIAHTFLIDSNEFTGMDDGFHVDVWGEASFIYDLTVSNNNFYDIIGQGFEIFGVVGDASATSSPYGIDINGNTFTDTGYQAILIGAGLRQVADHPNYIRNNVLTNIGTESNPNINAIQCNWCRYVDITYNSITNVLTSAPDGCGIYPDIAWASQTYRSSNVNVLRNIVTGCVSGESGQSGGICAGSTSDSVFAYNHSYGNGFGIDMSSSGSTGNVFYNNTVDGNVFGAVFPRDAIGVGLTPASTWTNNKFTNNSQYGFYYTIGNTPPTETYNLFSGNGTANIWGASSYYPNNGTFANTHDSEANSVYLGSKISLSEAATIGYVGANFVIFAQSECWVALYNADGSELLAHEHGAVSEDGWLDVLVNYAATAGTYQIWANCNAAWKIKESATDCTTGKKMWNTGASYPATPPASQTQNVNDGCYAVRHTIMQAQSLAASDMTSGDGAGAGILIDGIHNLAAPAKDVAGNDVVWGPSTGASNPTSSTPTWASLNGAKLLRASQAVTISGDHSAETLDLSNAVNTGTLTVSGEFSLGKIIGIAAVNIVGSNAVITAPIELGDNVKMQGFRAVHE